MRSYETAFTSLSLNLAGTGCGLMAAENPFLEPLERLRVPAAPSSGIVSQCRRMTPS